MDLTEEKVSFDQMPTVVSELKQEISGLKTLVRTLIDAADAAPKDNRLRYVKQVKVRAGAFTYDASNIIVYEVEKVNGFLRFNFREFATEEEHLRHRESAEISEQEIQVLELSKQGLSCRKIAEQVRISKSTVNNILNRHKDELSTVQPDIGGNGQLDIGQQDKSNQEYDEPTLL